VLAGVALAVLVRFGWQMAIGGAVHDGAPAWSPDGTRIVFSGERDDQTDLYVMDAAGTDRRQVTSTPAEENAPAFSPDGRTIAFETNRDGNFEIYLVDVNGRDPRRLTTSPADDRSPSWSPDGQRLVFLSDRDHPKRFDLYTMRADGSDVARLTNDRTTWSPSFSPDGSTIAMQAGGDIELIPVAGGVTRRLTTAPANGMSPTWAPDGQRFAFVTTRNGKPELYTMTSEGTNQQLLVSMPHGATIDPRWSPDGSRIAFVYVADDKSGASREVQDYGIYTVELNTLKVTRISP
jgi:Tol biopolymer transport system component